MLQGHECVLLYLLENLICIYAKARVKAANFEKRYLKFIKGFFSEECITMKVIFKLLLTQCSCVSMTVTNI